MRNDRTKLRGSQLLPMCKRAKISKNEGGPQDKRLFCYGLIDQQDEELLDECLNCRANVIYADVVCNKIMSGTLGGKIK